MEESKPEDLSSLSWEETLPHLLNSLLEEDYSKSHTFTSELLLSESRQIPASAKRTIQHIHCRTLLHLKNYQQVIEYCDTAFETKEERHALALEEAYAIYKLGNYVHCRDYILTRNTTIKASINGDGVTVNEEAFLHLLAQCYYRLHQTDQASQIYKTILLKTQAQRNQPKDDTTNPTIIDTEEEVLTNALAAHISNLSSSTTSLDDVLLQALSLDDNYTYDLAYNYATYLLLSSTGLTQTKRALELLQSAQADCKEDQEGGGGNDNDSLPIQANLALAQLQSGDLNEATRSYLGLILASKQSKPGDETTTTTSVTCKNAIMVAENNMTVVQSIKKKIGAPSASSSSSSSALDILKRLPDLSTMIDRSNKHKPTTTTGASPNQIRILLYNRAVLYYQMAKYGDCQSVLTDLKRSLDATPSGPTDRSTGSGTSGDGGGNNTKHGGTNRQKQKKKNKKKRPSKKTTTGANSDGTSEGTAVASNYVGLGKTLPAPTASSADSLLWKCRIAVLESEISEHNSSSSNSGSSIEELKKEVTTALKEEEKKKNDDDHDWKECLEMILAELTLYSLEKSSLKKKRMSMKQKKKKESNDNSNSAASPSKSTMTEEEEQQKEILSTLEQLPKSIHSRPAIIATISAIYGNLGMVDKVTEILDLTSSESGGGPSNSSSSRMAHKKKSLADYKLRLELYEEAASLYESTLKAVEDGVTDANGDVATLSDVEILECQAGLVKALSFCDIDRAVDLASEVDLRDKIDEDGNDGDELDGEELESMDIPRLGQNAGGTGGSNRMRKLLSAHRAVEDTQRKSKKNQEAILRKRARKREVYLQMLQKEGRYNPDRPAKPDPERWIPKNQRSYSKRGRRARYKFVGAQGGGTGAGADKDAAKLDAAARAAARAEGKDTLSQQPSTAHLSVSSNGAGVKGGRRR